MITVLIAISVPDAIDISDNFQSYSDNVKQALRNIKRGGWAIVPFNGTNYIIFKTLLEKDAWLSRIETKFPAMRVIGVWRQNGLQVGVIRDSEGNLSGSPVYPIPVAKLLAAMPLDSEGNTQTTVSDNNGIRYQGWSELVYN